MDCAVVSNRRYVTEREGLYDPRALTHPSSTFFASFASFASVEEARRRLDIHRTDPPAAAKLRNRPPLVRMGLGLVQGTRTLHTQLAPRNPGCSQRW
eukprot:2752623-Pyramimonas_sp.AAC.1